jgi:hypothetical protein
VLRDGKRKKFFFDTSAYRRGISGRIFIELINGPFLYEHKGNPAEYGAGLNLAIDRGWPWRGRLPP